MGMDIIGVTYAALPGFDPDTIAEKAEEIIRRALFALPQERVEEIEEEYSYLLDDLDDDDTEDENREALVGYAMAGFDDYHMGRTGGHRFHAFVASSPDDYHIIFAGGGSWGDDPWEGFSSLCFFLHLASMSEHMRAFFHVETNIERLLKPLSEV